MKFGIAVLLICCVLYIPTCNGTCSKLVHNSCLQKLTNARDKGIKSYAHACSIVDDYVVCLKPCENEVILRANAYAGMLKYGIKCGSSMATLSGALGILTVLTTLKNYF